MVRTHSYIKHAYREANQLVGKLANESYKHQGPSQWSNFLHLTGTFKGIIEKGK